MPVITNRRQTFIAVDSNLSLPGKWLQYDVGQVIVEAQVDTNYVYEIISGLAKVYTLNGRGEQYIHLIYGPGELFPLTWLTDYQFKEAYVESIQPITLMQYDKSTFLQALQTNPAISFQVMKRAVAQLTIYAARLDNLEYRYASQRLAYRLIFLAQRFGIDKKGMIVLPPLTNHDIACTINLSRESVNRGLARLNRLGLIRIKGNVIYIKDLDGLLGEISRSTQPLFINKARDALV